MANQPLFVSQNINALALFFCFLCEKPCLCSCRPLRRRGTQLLISMQSLLWSSSVERTPPLQHRSRLCLACSEGEKLNKQIDLFLQVVFPHPTGVGSGCPISTMLGPIAFFPYRREFAWKLLLCVGRTLLNISPKELYPTWEFALWAVSLLDQESEIPQWERTCLKPSDSGINSITLQQILSISWVICAKVVNTGVVGSCRIGGGLRILILSKWLEEVFKYFPWFSDFGWQKFWLCCRLEKEPSGSWVGRRVRPSSAATATPPPQVPGPALVGPLPTSRLQVSPFSSHLTLLLGRCPTFGASLIWVEVCSASPGAVSGTLEVEWKAWPEISATVNGWGCPQFLLYLLLDLCIDVMAILSTLNLALFWIPVLWNDQKLGLI